MREIEIDSYQKVFVKILNFLSFKPRTSKEVETKLTLYLKKEKIPQLDKENLKQRIFLQLKDDGYIDDLKVAQMYAEGFKSSRKARSIRSLKNTMLKKGFSRQDTEIALENISTEVEVEGALKVARRRLLGLKNATKMVKRAKIMNFLYSKGYSPDTINAVVDTLLRLQ